MSDHGFHPDHLRPKAIPVEPAGPAVEHRDLGIFVACGPGIKKDHVLGGANLLDVTPTILSLYGLPYGEDMDGKPLVEMFEEGIEVLQIPSWETVPGRDGQHPPGTAFDPQQSKETMEQLIALGYIDRPDNDATVAVENCQCELDYNLARAYLDAERYGDAIPLLVDLYNKFPLEFRFGLQLSNCLKAMGRIGELESLVMDLNQRWREAMKTAKKKLRQVRKIMRERRKQYSELQKLDEENKREGKNFPKLAQVDAHGKPLLFSPTEAQAIRKIRAVAKGNPQVLDFLSATIAASKGNFEEALEFMEKAKVSKSTNPTFHYQLGNFYLGLKRPHDAEAAFLKALEIDELHPLALMGLSRTYLELGQPKKGVDFASQAIAIKYHFPLGHYYLGEAKETARDFDGAIASYKTSLQQNPNFSEAHERLARIYKRQRHDSALAKEHATAAKDLNQIQSDYIETVEPIVLKPAESHDFEKLLPKIDEDNTADFVRCLAQAKPMFSRETAIVPDGQPAVVIVTGLPRSGTSMMMQMLVAGGIPAFVDDNRQPDESNPKGYYESEKVKKLAYLNNWVRDCQGKVVKVVAPLVFYLPQGLNYRVILMNRDIDEVVESQEKMLERLNRSGGDLTSDRFAELFRNQLFNCLSLLKIHNIPHCEIEYSEAISDPELVARKVNSFLNGTLDVDAMKRAVDPNLYRQKKQEIVS
jgi:tetratricopeptide (TPR) repeat protein